MARVRHGQADWLSFHVTTRTTGGAFYLASPEEKKRILDALAFYRKEGRFRLYGFVVMDNHLHLVIQPEEEQPLADIMRDFKTWTSRTNRLKPRGRKLWERRYDDNRIDSADELRSVLRYMHENPVRARMATAPQDYPYSSVHNYLRDGRELIEIDTDW